ncbi:hypothetical protein PV963_06995 [Streptomyces coeruleorubidus]|uniref:hypothetical protein n=1 Tax=Streptomyces coeruleorubidus TaxID=116188 RepID=UPI00237EF26C|nr:hypothetical protein [Streptomyces coeruleorubidus]WDV50130.1 hypothetical protein PV963_06995 [Streptomyces coeruleorubidus]
MPTITIRTPELPVPRRRAVALRLTRWLTAQGVQAGHVVVRFEPTEDGTVFSGGMPVEALPYETDGSGLRHASVTVCVGPDRDDTFRDGLARCITEALGADARTPFCYLEFRPTSPSDVYLGAGERLRRADGTAVEPAPAAV